MEILTVGVDISKHKVGVLICRFQLDELHEGHKRLVDFVCGNHKQVIIFLGIPRITNTKRNPLDFETRKAMVLASYPDVIVLPLFDQRYNDVWSQKLDEACMVPFGETTCVLYGSRDSFIPYYSGKFPTVEVKHTVEKDATSIRKQIAEDKPRKSSDFRAGVIYATYQKRPVVHPTVDVAVLNKKGMLLLARKPAEQLFRFVGGFVDPSDIDLEAAGRRELFEETKLSGIDMKFITSKLVDDWRYAREESKIMTNLLLAFDDGKIGNPEADDDIAEVKWFDINDLNTPEKIEVQIMPEHRELMLKLITQIRPKTWFGRLIKKFRGYEVN